MLDGLAWIHLKREKRRNELIGQLREVLKRSVKGQNVEEDRLFVERYLNCRNSMLSREDFVRTCLSMGIEPISLKDSLIGRVSPEVIPKKTVEEAWRFILSREGKIRALFSCKDWNGLDFDDVFSTLLKHFFILALYFDYTRGSFTNYILKSYSQASRELELWRYPVKVGTVGLEFKQNYERARDIAYALGKPERIGSLLKVGEEKQKKMKEVFYSLSALEEPLPLHEVEGNSQDPESSVLHAERQILLSTSLDRLFSHLDERRAFILKARFGIELGERELNFARKLGKLDELEGILDNPTLKRLGEFLEITYERVRQLEAQAISTLKLRVALEKEMQELGYE